MGDEKTICSLLRKVQWKRTSLDIRDDFLTKVRRQEGVCYFVNYVTSMQSSTSYALVSSGVQNKEKLINRHVSGTRLVHILRPKCGQDQGCTNPGRQATCLKKNIRKFPTTPRLSVWNSLHTTVTAPKISKICAPPSQD